jgi:hypothetical protein
MFPFPRSEAEVWLGIPDPPMFYDRAGNPIPMIRSVELRADFHYIVVAKTEVGGVWEVSTVWLGNDHGFGFGPPLIFETMVFEIAESHGYVGPSRWTGEGWSYRFRAAYDGYSMRYSSETEARAGHAAIVAETRELFLPVQVSPTADERAAPGCGVGVMGGWEPPRGG